MPTGYRSGTIALFDDGAQPTGEMSSSRSDRCDEFVERGSDPQTRMAGFDTEFVVAASQVLDERMTADHGCRGAIGSQTAHRAKPCLSRPWSRHVAFSTPGPMDNP